MRERDKKWRQKTDCRCLSSENSRNMDDDDDMLHLSSHEGGEEMRKKGCGRPVKERQKRGFVSGVDGTSK